MPAAGFGPAPLLRCACARPAADPHLPNRGDHRGDHLARAAREHVREVHRGHALGRAPDLRDAARVCVPRVRARRVPRARGVQVDAPDDRAGPRRVGPAARDRAVRALGVPPLPRSTDPRSGSSARREAPIPRHMPRWGVDEGGTVFSKRIHVSPAMGVALVALTLRRQRHIARTGRRDEDRQARERDQDQARLDSGQSPGQGRRHGRPDQEQLDHREADQREDARDRAQRGAGRTASRSRTGRPMRSARPMPTTRSRSAARLPPATSASRVARSRRAPR